MNQDVRVYSMIVEHDRETSMIEVIEQTIDRAKLDHDLIVPITSSRPNLLVYWLLPCDPHNPP